MGNAKRINRRKFVGRRGEQDQHNEHQHWRRCEYFHCIGVDELARYRVRIVQEVNATRRSEFGLSKYEKLQKQTVTKSRGEGKESPDLRDLQSAGAEEAAAAARPRVLPSKKKKHVPATYRYVTATYMGRCLANSKIKQTQPTQQFLLLEVSTSRCVHHYSHFEGYRHSQLTPPLTTKPS